MLSRKLVAQLHACRLLEVGYKHGQKYQELKYHNWAAAWKSIMFPYMNISTTKFHYVTCIPYVLYYYLLLSMVLNLLTLFSASYQSHHEVM